MARPFGPFALWSSATQMKQDPTVFTMSQNFTDYVGTTPYIVTQINTARTKGQKLALAMTGGPPSNYLTNGFFDIDKWTARMDHFNTAQIKEAIAQGVEEEIVLGASVLDEPEHRNWGWLGSNNDTSFITKALLDTMGDYVRGIFPTLPVGVNHGPTGFLWRETEHYTKFDYLVNQYNWWINNAATGVVTGNPATWRDAVFNQFATDNVNIVFSMNVLDGGNPSPSEMSAQEILDWGTVLGNAGLGLMLWQYNATFFADAANKASFQSLANMMNALPFQSWKDAAPIAGGEIEVVGTASVAGTSATLPAHNEGDTAVVVAFNENSGTIPGLGTGYTLVKADNSTGIAVKIGTKILGVSDTTTQTWANATHVQVVILRHTNPSAIVGVKATTQASASATIAYPALAAFTGTDGRSRALVAAVHSAATNVGTAPTGTSNQTVSATGRSAVHLTTAAVASWAQQTVGVNASGTWRSESVEILAEPEGTPPPTSPPVLDSIGNKTVQVNTLLTFQATATDPDSATLTYSLTGTPPGNAAITSSGAFTFTPTTTVGSPFSITVQVSDGANTDSETIQVTVVAPIIPTPPVYGTGLTAPFQRGTTAASSAD